MSAEAPGATRLNMAPAETVLVHDAEPAPLAQILHERHPDVSIATCSTYEGLAGALERSGARIVYSVRFAGTPGFPRDPLIEGGQVSWVAVGGSGTDHLAPWDPRRVTVTNSAGVAADMMAEYVLGAMLHFTLDVRGLMSDRRAKHWRRDRRLSPLGGKTVTITGLGKTGAAVARRSKALGLRVLGVRARPAAMADVDEVGAIAELGDFCRRTDFLVVCVPLTPLTRGLIGREVFSALKPGAVVIDVSRGGVMDQSALVDGLRSGRLGGAALDVFESEPLPTTSALWTIENVLLSPHCSSVYEGWERNSMRLFCDNLARWRAGEPLDNVVDPRRGY